MLHIYKGIDELLQAHAAFFIATANEAILKKNKFVVALSGGNSPKKLFQLLASDQYKNQTDWSRMYFFFGDERYVPFDHPDSNSLMAKKAFLDVLNINDDQVCIVDTSLDPTSAALDYEKKICRFFKDDEQAFDLILLGLGDDAHTASLFPGTSVLWIDEEMVKEVYLSDKATYRITMTAPLINKAHKVAFFTYGENKANAVYEVIKGEKNIIKYPAQLIKPLGELHWFLDEAAASKL